MTFSDSLTKHLDEMWVNQAWGALISALVLGEYLEDSQNNFNEYSILNFNEWLRHKYNDAPYDEYQNKRY